MSTEQRDVRPFAAVDVLDDLLRHAQLRVGVETLESGGKLVLDEDVYLRAPISLMLPGASEELQTALDNAHDGLAALDLTQDDISFVVVLYSGFLKIAEFVSNVPICDLPAIGPTIDLSTTPRPRAFRSPRSGCQIEALVYLSTQRARKPLRPWRFGTWLSRAEFNLATEHAFTGFTPKPLTIHKKSELGLPPKTVRYVTLGGISPLEDDVTEDSVELWIDADLLAKMSAMPKGKASVSLQRQFFVDAVATVVAESRATPGFGDIGWSDLKNTLIGRVVLAIAPSSAREEVREAACAAYLDIIKTNPARFLAYTEEAAGLISALDSQLEG